MIRLYQPPKRESKKVGHTGQAHGHCSPGELQNGEGRHTATAKASQAMGLPHTIIQKADRERKTKFEANLSYTRGRSMAGAGEKERRGRSSRKKFHLI